jgi:hypothetical protein
MLELARVKCTILQHSPSRATNPEGLQVQCNLELWECLSEDVCSHIFCGAILDVDVPVGDGLSNKMKLNVDVLCVCMIVVICHKVNCGLVVAVEGSGCGNKAK